MNYSSIHKLFRAYGATLAIRHGVLGYSMFGQQINPKRSWTKQKCLEAIARAQGRQEANERWIREKHAARRRRSFRCIQGERPWYKPGDYQAQLKLVG